MKQFINVKNYLFGEGASSKLHETLQSNPTQGGRRLFLVDHFFSDGALCNSLKIDPSEVLYLDTTHEPSTNSIDEIVGNILKETESVTAVVGIGGGATLDTAKAVSNVLGNGGKAADYQGWDLLKKPGVFKVGVPTLSGTGAEASRTCVLLNAEKGIKLGMNSDFTVFDALVLDPSLSETVPREQYFYTGLDSYAHCFESLQGSYRNPIVDALSEKTIALCRDVFLSGDMMSPANREKLMVASYLGGSAAGNVGVVHPLSAGLSVVLGTPHCLANCLVMNVMEEFYPAETDTFLAMLDAQGIELPTGVCKDCTDEEFERLYESSIVHSKPLENALGPEFRSILTQDKVRSLFERM